jgi:hypothetical protein
MLVGPKWEIFPPVIFPLVAFPPVILPSGVLMFCAFTELRPTIASIHTIAARRGTIRTNFVLIDSLLVLPTYKGFEVELFYVMLHTIKLRTFSTILGVGVSPLYQSHLTANFIFQDV